MADPQQETFTDVQPIQQKAAPAADASAPQETFTDVTPITVSKPPIAALPKNYSKPDDLPKAAGAPVTPSGEKAATQEGMHYTGVIAPIKSEEQRKVITTPTATENHIAAPFIAANEKADKMAQAGAEAGREAGAGWVQGASGGASGMSPTPRQTPLTDEQSRALNPTATGIAEGVGGFIGGTVADPRQVAMLVAAMPVAEAGPIFSRVLAAGFAANMGKDTYEGVKALQKDWDSLTEEQRGERMGQLGITGLLTAATAYHASGFEPKTPEVKQAEANVKALEADRATAQAAYDKALAEHNKHTASHAQGIQSPEKVVKELNKTKAALDEATAHHELAKEALASKVAAQRAGAAGGKPAVSVKPTPAPAPEVPTEAIEAQPSPLKPLGTPEPAPALPAINVKTPGQIQPETFPQTPTEQPRTPLGRIELAGGQGTMGKPPLLTEGTPEGPQLPPGGLPQIKMPEAPKPAPQPAAVDEAALRALSAKEGKVVETPEKKVGRLLQEALKPTEKTKETPAPETKETPEEYKGEERRENARPATMTPTEIEEAMKSRKPVHTPFDVTQGAMDTIKRDKDLPKSPAEEFSEKTAVPKSEPTGYKAKNEEVVPTGAEGREAAKSAEEYHPAVEQKVNELSDENLKKLAKAHGLNPDEYDFNARDERRHRVERDQLAKDIVAQMGEDEKINIGRAAESAERREPGFASRDTTAQSKAARAEKIFPRLRGPVDQYGNPTIRGGAPEWEPPKGLENGISHDDPVDTEIPLDKISVSKRSLEGAQRNIAGGRGTKTEGPVSLFYNTDNGQFLVEDGMHRIAKAHAEGKTSIPATLWSGYSDTIANVRPEDKAELGKSTAGTKEEAEKYANPEKGIPETSLAKGPEAEAMHAATVASDKLAEGWKNAIEEKPKAEKTQTETHNENGGSTFHPEKGDLSGTSHFAVGGEPEFKNADLKMTTDGKNLTKEQLDEFKNRPAVKEALEKHKDASVGTWFDKDTGKTTTELVKTPTDRDEAIAMGQKNGEKAIYDLKKGEEIKTTNEKGSPIDEFGNPTVSGGAPEKKLPTGDQLIKKYGESSGDPKDLTFILKDGRGVKNTGNIHDEMLGGKATDKNPPRERFIAEGNIRVRPHQGTAGREVAFSIPKEGVNQAQLKYIQKMAPQLRSGAVAIEVGSVGGAYKIIPYGEATPEHLETVIRGLGPVLNDKGTPIDEFGNPTVSGGSPAAGTKQAKEGVEGLKEKLPELAQKHLTEEEKNSLTTTATGKPRTAGTTKFIENMEKIPSVQEYKDIALAGEGARKWYSRSTAAFDAMHEEAPDYFKEGDKDKFMGVLAGSSPQQSVAMNLREALGFWKEWNDAGRPVPTLDKWKQFGEEADKAWKDYGSPRSKGLKTGASMHWDYAPQGPEWKAENLFVKNLTLPDTKVPNIIKALRGEDMWPDLTKNAAFKAPSFAENLRKWINGKSTGTKNVTNDSWMGLFGGIDKSALSKPENYHPLSVATRAAAEELGWEPEEAQAAIWSFTQALTEKGEEDPEIIRQYSEDFKDLLANDEQTRSKLEDLGVNLDQLDKKLEAIGEKPEISGRSTATTSRSVEQLKQRIEEARGKGAIPPAKSAQGELGFREPHPTRTPVDEAVGFDPEKFRTQTDEPLTKLGEKKKKSPFGTIR